MKKTASDYTETFQPMAKKAFIGIYLACSMGLNAVVLKPIGAEEESRAFVMSWLLLHAITGVIFLLVSFRGVSLRSLIFITILSFYVLAVTALGPGGRLGLPYAVMLVGNLMFAQVVVSWTTLDELMALLRRLIVTLVVLSLLLTIAGYQNVLYFDTHQRLNVLGLQPIRGLFAHKIMAALFAGIGIALVIEAKDVRYKWPTVAVLIYFVLMTGSSTGIAVVVGLFAIRFLVQVGLSFKISFPLFMTLFLYCVLCGALLIAPFWEQLLDLLGRDATLTGRTLLWQWGIDVFWQRPFFGWGLKNYFLGPEAATMAASFIEFQNYDVPHFHQSFIQTAVDFGGVGLCMLLLLLFKTLGHHYDMSRGADNKSSRQFLQITLLNVVSGLVMAVYLSQNHVVTILLLIGFLHAIDDREIKPIQAIRKV